MILTKYLIKDIKKPTGYFIYFTRHFLAQQLVRVLGSAVNGMCQLMSFAAGLSMQQWRN